MAFRAHDRLFHRSIASAPLFIKPRPPMDFLKPLFNFNQILPNMFRRILLLCALVPLLLACSATTTWGQAFGFLVTQAGGEELLSDSPDPYVAGQPFEVQVSVYDAGGMLYEDFDRDVTLELRGQYGQAVPIFIERDDFVDGVADGVEVTPEHAGTDIMRFWATDGNIITDNASGFFSIEPARFEVTYIGGNQSLAAHDITDGESVWVRVRALNADDDETVATGYRGTVYLQSTNALMEPTEVSIGFGGISDFNHRDIAELDFAAPGEGEIIQASTDEENWADASDAFDVLAAGTNIAEISVDRVTRQGRLYPGYSQTIRYRLTNEEAEPGEGEEPPPVEPIDTLFRLREDAGDEIVLQWIEQHEGLEPATDSGDLYSSFILPQNLLGNGASYTLEILPSGSTENMEEVEITIDTNPDLAIVHLNYAPGTYRGGEGIRFHATFRNLSTDGVDSSRPTSAVADDQKYKFQLHLSADPEFGTEDDFLVWEESYRGNDEGNRFLPGQQIDVVGEFVLPENFDGTYYLLARINSAGGRDGSGFEPETRDSESPGNNTTKPNISQQIAILPNQATETTRVSLADDGAQSDGRSDNAVVSADGRYVAFDSMGSLAGSTTPGVRNVFIRNTESNTTSLVSVASSGAASESSGNPSLSADGRYIVFDSAADNLVSDDTNGYADIFVRDRQEGTTRRLTVNPETEEQANHGSQLARISANGRFVVFESTATNLVSPGTPAGVTQIYLYDRDVDGLGVFDSPGNTSITLVTQSENGPGMMDSVTPAISRDGGYVVFATRDLEILGNVFTPFPQIVRWSRQSGEFTIVSVAFDDSDLYGDNISGYPAINGDGSYVAFASRAQNMTDPEEDFYGSSIPHVFRARIEGSEVTQMVRLNTGTNREPRNPSGVNSPVLGSYEPTISEDGQSIAYTSESNNLLPPLPVYNVDRRTILSSGVFNHADFNRAADIYLYQFNGDLEAPSVRRVSVSSFGHEATWLVDAADTFTFYPPASRRPAISPDGRYVAFTSDAKGRNGLVFGATNYIHEATNGLVSDVYLFDLKSGLTDPEGLPTVDLLMPGRLNAIAGDFLRLSAKAISDNASIASVEFYVNNILVGTVPAGAMDYWGQLTLNWRVPALPGNVNPKSYTIAALAVDSNGLRSKLSNLTRVTANPVATDTPAVTITSPASDAILTNRSVWPFAAAVTTQEHDVDYVEFFINRAGAIGRGISMGAVRGVADQTSFVFPFDLGDLPSHFVPFTRLTSGDYQITAVAWDRMGNQAQSPAIPVTVVAGPEDRPNPLSLQASKSEVAANETVLFTLEIADPLPPMAGVALYGNGGELALMDRDVGSFQPGKFWSWAGPLPASGDWEIYAIAVDANGNTGVSDPVSVTVKRALLRIDAPGQANVGDPLEIALEVLAGNPVIGSVEFLVDGAHLSTDFNAPYFASWTPDSPGTYELEVRVWDAEIREYLIAPPITVFATIPPEPPVFSWTSRSSGNSSDFHSVVTVPGGMIAVGEGGIIAESGNGVGWSTGSAGVSQTLRDVTEGEDVLVAVGDVGSNGFGTILVSANGGGSWSPTTSGTPRRLSSVTYGAGRFVAVGDAGVIRISDDAGETWQNRASGVSENLHAVTYGAAGGVRFVAVGANGVLLTSIDGEVWESQTTGTSASLHDVTYGDGRFVAVGGRWISGGDSARILTSFDGFSWTVSGSSIPSILHGVGEENGAWVVSGSGGLIATSGDGFTWLLDDTSPTTTTLLSVTYGQGRFVAVGRDGAIVSSAPGNFETWVAQEFSSEQQADSNISGSEADPYGLGVPNLIRFALEIEDAETRQERMPKILVLSDTTDSYLALRYVRPKEQKSVKYIVEASTDMLLWKSIESIGGTVTVEENASEETVTARDGVPISASGETRFLRLRVEDLD